MKIVQVPIDEDLLAHLDRRAQASTVSRAALIRQACASYLRQLERDERSARYLEGYRRAPEIGAEDVSLAWLAGADLPAEEWPDAPRKKA